MWCVALCALHEINTNQYDLCIALSFRRGRCKRAMKQDIAMCGNVISRGPFVILYVTHAYIIFIVGIDSVEGCANGV